MCYERLIFLFFHFDGKNCDSFPNSFPPYFILYITLSPSSLWWRSPLLLTSCQSNVKPQQTILVAGRGSEHITLERRPATVDNLTEGKTGGSEPCSFGFPLTDRESTGEFAPLYYNLPSACSFSCYHELSRSNVYYLNCVRLSFHRPVSTIHHLYYYITLFIYCYYYYLPTTCTILIYNMPAYKFHRLKNFKERNTTILYFCRTIIRRALYSLARSAILYS